MSATVQARSHGPLRDFLMQLDPHLAEAANQTWTLAGEIHGRQTTKGGNVNGRVHVERVEQNIWRLLTETADHSLKKNLERFSPTDLYLLSCAACCHDFDKGLHNEVLPDNFTHGEGSGAFVLANWEALSIESEAAAAYIDLIVSVHDFKEEFDQKLHAIPDRYVLSEGDGHLLCLATLLKAADTLHIDASRVCRLAVPDDSLLGSDREKQIARGSIHGWWPDGERIVIRVWVSANEVETALRTCTNYIEKVEWPPIGRNLKEWQFPHRIEFDWEYAGSIRPKPIKESVLSFAGSLLNVKSIESRTDLTRALVEPPLLSDVPLNLIAVPPDKLAEYLGEVGPLTVIDNPYINPDFTELGSVPGAVNRIYVGPANCGKTRAACEWIRRKVGLDSHRWVVLRPASGSIPQDASKFIIEHKHYYGRSLHLPTKAILFADDLPEYLPALDTRTAASEAVSRLLTWFGRYPGFQDRCFVGTIRSERMHESPGWPDRLIELGKLRLLRVEPLDDVRRRTLWKGMSEGRTFENQRFEKLNLEIDEGFLDAVAGVEADPEAIAYYAREMARRGKQRINHEDAASFNADVTRIWIDLAWPTMFATYGSAVSVFLAISRFIEAGARPGSGFRQSLTPDWEYHAVFGPPLLAGNGGEGDEYLPVLRRMLKDGNASGVAGESIRPKFDFLLQAPNLEEIEVSLPTAQWFALHACGLSHLRQQKIASHLASAARVYTGEAVTVHWLFGYALAMDGMAENDMDHPNDWREQALEALDEVVRRFGDDLTPAVQEKVARAILKKSFVLERLDRYEEVVALCDELARRFADDKTPEVRKQVAEGLLLKGLVLNLLNRQSEALAAYVELGRRFGHDETAVVRRRAATGLLHHASTLHELGRDDESVAAYDELVHRFGDDRMPDVREQVAEGLFRKGLALERTGRKEEALNAYDDLVRQFGAEKSPDFPLKVIRSLVRKVVTLHEIGRSEEAIAASDDLVRRFGVDETPDIREALAIALVMKVLVLDRLGRAEEAVESCNEVVTRLGGEQAPNIRQWVAMGLVLKGLALGKLGRDEESMGAYDELVRRFGDDETPSVRMQVAEGLSSKGLALDVLGRYGESMEVYDELVHRFGDDETPDVRKEVAEGLLRKSRLLEKLHREAELVEACDELVHRFGDDETPDVRERVARVLVMKGFALGQLGRHEESVEAYEELLRRFGDDETPEVRIEVAGGLFRKGLVLEKLLRDGDSVEACDELVHRFGDDERPHVRTHVASGLLLKGAVLEKLGRDEKSVEAFDELVRRFGDDETPDVRKRVAMGLDAKMTCLVRLWRKCQDKRLLEYGVSAGRKAVEMGESCYNLACGLALAGERDEALELLERSLGDGEKTWPEVAEDADWVVLHDDPRYQRLETKYGTKGQERENHGVGGSPE